MPAEPLTDEEARVLRIVKSGAPMSDRDIQLAIVLSDDAFVKLSIRNPMTLTRAGALALAAYDKEHDGK